MSLADYQATFDTQVVLFSEERDLDLDHIEDDTVRWAGEDAELGLQLRVISAQLKDGAIKLATINGPGIEASFSFSHLGSTSSQVRRSDNMYGNTISFADGSQVLEIALTTSQAPGPRHLLHIVRTPEGELLIQHWQQHDGLENAFNPPD
ncbi:MAG: hypothetical protein PF961_04195 [Planctomycetota bacterium]|nr:hypothetical protein [Planctomycetota bacterium]